MTYIPPTTVTMTYTNEATADIGEETLGLNITIVISIVAAVVVLIVVGVVAILVVIVTVIISRRKGNQSEGKVTSNATQAAVVNGVGKLKK